MMQPKHRRDARAATVPVEAWDRTHPDHDWWVNGRGWCFDRHCPDHTYGPLSSPESAQNASAVHGDDGGAQGD